MTSAPRSIHIWVPGIREGSGGIQAFSRSFVEAVHRIYPKAELRVIVKNDAPLPDDPLRRLPVTFHSVHRVPTALRTAALAGLGVSLGLMDSPELALATHVHFLPALMMLRKLKGTRCAAVLHGIEAWNLKGGSRVKALRNADGLYAVSRFTRDQVASRFGVDRARIDVVPNTFDASRFQPGPKPAHLLARFGLRPEQPVLLTVSRLALSERYKGHREVLHALPRILEIFPDLRYIIAGEGDDLPRLRETVQALGLGKVVTFAGLVPGAQLPDFYNLCDVFVMPSTKEGFGIVFLEAMSTGKPVVAGNVDGSVDALDDGRLGVLVDPSNPRLIAETITDVLRRHHPNKLIHQPEALRQAVEKTFGEGRFTSALGEVLESLAVGQAAVRPAAVAKKEDTRTPAHSQRAEVPRITIVTQLTSPYQAELFNEIAVQGRCRLDVIYLTSRDRGRQWLRPAMAHSYVILDEDKPAPDFVKALLDSDLIVFNNYVSLFTLRALAKRAKSGRPWVFWGERPGFFHLGALGRWFRRLVLRPLHRSCAPVWGIGEFGVEGYRKEFGDDRSYRDIPYFSNLTRFKRKPEAAGAKTGTVFLFSGSLSRRKGAEILAQAFAKVAAARADVHLIVMGEGTLKPVMERMLAQAADRVTWEGFRNWKDLPEVFARADILCAPSLHDGWGLAVVQGLAAGLPVIGTDRSGATLEFVRQGTNGWMCPTGNVDAITRAMLDAADRSPDQRARMSAAASASVENHSLEKGAELFCAAATEAIRTWKVPVGRVEAAPPQCGSCGPPHETKTKAQRAEEV